MRFLVDELPKTCGECKFNAKAMMRSPLGVMKEVVLCTLQTTLIPPVDISQPPNAIDVTKSPEENGCICKVNAGSKSSGNLIL